MAGIEWSLLTVSLIAVSLLTWLGLTVLLTAERRSVFVWLVGLALFSGATLMAFHAGLISHGLDSDSPLALSQWPLTWVAGIALPFAWYLAILWHAGFWDNRRALRHRHLHTLAFYTLVIILGAATVIVLFDPIVRTNPQVLISAFDPATILAGPYWGRLPLIAVIYLLLIIASILLALDALYHPAPSHRLMGNLARERARPWLTATTFALLAISLLVCVALLRFMPDMLFIRTRGLPTATAQAMVWIDLAIAILVAITTILLGQAVIAYEIFTSKVLPRRGLRRKWLGAVMLAVAFSMLLATGLVLHASPIFGALLVIGLLAIAYAVSTRQGFVEHKRAIEDLRAQHAGPPLYHTLVSGAQEHDADTTAFGTLCGQVLGLQLAHLYPLGSLSSLLRPLAFPPDAAMPDLAPSLPFTTPKTLCLPLDPVRHGGAIWAIPLWSDHNLNGVLLLGSKQDRGLFTQEEVEIARMLGERLLDNLAGAELARRLVQLQRARMMESQVVDQRTRRALHDEVLPSIHTLMLTLSGGQLDTPQIIDQLAELHEQIANILHAMPAAGMSVVATRGVLAAVRQYVDVDCHGAFAAVEWEIDEDAATQSAMLPALITEVLYGAAREAIRNAARHAAGGDARRPIRLRIAVMCHDDLRLTVEDDGAGIDAPYLTPAGAGHGITLHSTLMAVIGGAWETESRPHAGTRVTLVAPIRALAELPDGQVTVLSV